MIDPLGGSTTFVYDAENRLSTRTLPNGVVTSYTYDARDRPLSVVHRNASNVVLVSRTYVRAPGGEPTRITKEDGSYVEIGYDVALRITSERYYTAAGVPEEELGYTYDADGNRLTKTVDGVISTYSYAAGSRLVGVRTEGELEARTTDNGGRETGLVVNGRQLSLTYDSNDHVTRVVDGSATTDLAFDALGRRVGVTTPSGSKRFLTAPNAGNGYESPQAITDATGAVLASYVFAGEVPLAKTTSAGTEYYLADAMGSVIGTAGSSGSLVSTIEYDAFGNELAGAAVQNATYGEFRLHGMWKDPSGLYYVRARVYDAEAGRFTSRDIAPVQSLQPESAYPYAFSNSNPHVWCDPSGELSNTLASIGAAINGMISLSALQVARFAPYVMTARIVALAAPLRSVTFSGLIRDLPLRSVSYAQVYRAFTELGFKVNSHFIGRVLEYRTGAMGFSTLRQIELIFRNGALTRLADPNRFAVVWGDMAIIVDKATGMLVTLTPWQH